MILVQKPQFQVVNFVKCEILLQKLTSCYFLNIFTRNMMVQFKGCNICIEILKDLLQKRLSMFLSVIVASINAGTPLKSNGFIYFLLLQFIFRVLTLRQRLNKVTVI